MMFWNRLQEKRQTILRSLRETLGLKTGPKSQEVREEIFRRLESAVTSEVDQKVFPYRKIVIRLKPPKGSAAREFHEGLVKDASLETGIYKLFKENRVQCFDMEISVELSEENVAAGKHKDSGSMFEMEYLEPAIPARTEIPELQLDIVKGNAEQHVYRITKDRLLVGALPEVYDLEGRLVRKNNIVFPHEGDVLNATVGTMHARIWFDFQKQEFRVMDESSRYGTRIVREGHTIEVPRENPRGVGLRSGDEVYFGQTCFRFTIVKKDE